MLVKRFSQGNSTSRGLLQLLVHLHSVLRYQPFPTVQIAELENIRKITELLFEPTDEYT
jgi:hypothetical protein